MLRIPMFIQRRIVKPTGKNMEEEMTSGGLSKRFVFYRNVILAVLLVGWIVFCICTLIQIVNDYSPTPEEEAFSAWIKEF
ncbi:MAG: hypothetical protein IKS14_06345, partial [Thermoguttaceae bacterium]|nr:hypothetical protein [Thermoguttaceae bacterium]